MAGHPVIQALAGDAPSPGRYAADLCPTGERWIELVARMRELNSSAVQRSRIPLPGGGEVGAEGAG